MMDISSVSSQQKGLFHKSVVMLKNQIKFMVQSERKFLSKIELRFRNSLEFAFH